MKIVDKGKRKKGERLLVLLASIHTLALARLESIMNSF